MNNINFFLKVLLKYGYPNKDIKELANLSSYNLDYFLKDLVEELGENETVPFCKKALDKLSGKDGIKISFGNDEYVHYRVNVHGIIIRQDNLSRMKVDLEMLDSHLAVFDRTGKVESYLNIDDFLEYHYHDDKGIFEYTEYKLNKVIVENCGFGFKFSDDYTY